MQPITFNNQPPTPPDEKSIGPGGIPDGPSAINFPDGIDEARIISYCKTRNSTWDTWFDPIARRVAELHRIFRNKPLGPNSMTAMPVGYSTIESINARLAPMLLSKPKFGDAIPQFQAADNASTKNVEDFVNQRVAQETRKPETGKAAIKGAAIESVMIWRNCWNQKILTRTEEQTAVDPMTGQPVVIGQSDVEYMWECWGWEYKNMMNMAWDPHVTTNLQASPWVRERSKMSYNELLRWQREGRIEGVERLRTVIPKDTKGGRREDLEAMMKRADGDMNWSFTYADEKDYSIEEWWADVTWSSGEEVKSGKFKWFLVEGSVVLSFEDNPLIPKRHPYGSCPFSIDPHGLMGLSALDAVTGLQGQINKFSVYQDQQGERMAKPLVFYDDSSGVTGRTQFMKMFGFQAVTNVNGIKEFKIDSSGLINTQNYINFLTSMFRDSSGANEQFQGIEGAETLGEYQGLQATAGARFADVADTLAQGWLESLLTECYLHYKQFGVDGQMFVSQGTAEGMPIPVTKAELQNEYVWQASSNADEGAKKAQLEMATQAIEMGAKLGPSPEDGSVFNVKKAYNEIILPQLGMKNSSDWWVVPPMPVMPGAMPPAGAGMPTEGMPAPQMEATGV